jgi:LCP family protein required for cell wall assembly
MARPAWDGTSRFTILVLGIDRRPSEGDTLFARSDAMFLVSLDPATSTVGILHIPRDLHVIPRGQSEYVRVNALMVEGEQIEEGHGPQYVMDTLRDNLGIRIDTALVFDFEAFVTLVDAMGGVDVDVPYTINDPTFPDMDYGFDPLYIPKGLNHFDGEMALKYVRTRHGDSDYARGERQMQLLLAVRNKLLTSGMMPQLLAQAPELLEEMGDNVYTDIEFDEMLRLGLYVMSVGSAQMHTGSLSRDYVTRLRQADGTSLTVVNNNRLYELLSSVFGPVY